MCAFGHVLLDVLQAFVVRLRPAAIVMRADQHGGDVELACFNFRNLERACRRSGRRGGRRSGGRGGGCGCGGACVGRELLPGAQAAASIDTTNNTVINDHIFLDILLLHERYLKRLAETDADMHGGERLASFLSGTDANC